MNAFCKHFELMLCGIDILVTPSGGHLVIDCNYFGSYNGFEIDEMATRFD